MCGVSGIINKDLSPVQDYLIRSMNDLIKHRGPDGEGFYFKQNFAFGHRRLAIIDLTENGHQPMYWGDDLVITFNGEIYNYIELKNELKSFGHEFRTESDTEVILVAYKQWGTDCVSKFNGMWAFAIYDAQKQIIFCSRDRFGVKPFYYFQNEKLFAFGSEIKQLIPFLNTVLAEDQMVLDYLIAGFLDHTERTFFKDIIKLMPAHNLIYDLRRNQIQIRRYFEIETISEFKNLNEEKSIESYREILKSSVKLRMRSDVKVGTCLSGGLDSSSVTALASEIYANESDQKFVAIHAKTTESKFDESALAKQVADFCEVELKIIQPESNDFIAALDEVMYTQEEPFGSPSVYLQYFVLKKARELNCLVMLDGQGGDETLLGYEKYYPAYIIAQKGILKKWKAFNSATRNSTLSKKQLLSYFLYFTRYKIRLNRLKRRAICLRPEFLKTYESAEIKFLSEAYLDIDKLQRFEIGVLPLPELLRYEDKNSMRNSVETRLPFLDYRVLQTALSINHNYKIYKGWTKYVLRKSIEPFLPKSIVWRTNKFGFNAPEKTWLDQLESQINDEIRQSDFLNKFIDINKLNLKQTDLRTRWRLFNLSRWQKIYHVQTT